METRVLKKFENDFMQMDFVAISRVQPELFKKHCHDRYELLFFVDADGQYVMHRICRIRQGDYYLIGDAQTEIEGPIKRNQIFALVTQVKRKGKWIRPGDFWWFFFAQIWIRVIPLRRFIIRMYPK